MDSANFRRVLDRLVPPLVWAGVIFAVSAQSTVPGPSMSGLDKLVHFAVYALLGFLTTRAVRGFVRSLPLSVVLAVVLSTLYGASDEWHQSFVPGRTPEWLDLLADGLGACAGALTWYALERGPRARRRKEAP